MTAKEMFEKKQIEQESELLLLLDSLAPECLIYLGIAEKYAIASRIFKGEFALSRITDCNHIHKIIKESGKNCLSPKEIYIKFVDKRWI